jgi:hypothetical protein
MRQVIDPSRILMGLRASHSRRQRHRFVRTGTGTLSTNAGASRGRLRLPRRRCERLEKPPKSELAQAHTSLEELLACCVVRQMLARDGVDPQDVRKLIASMANAISGLQQGRPAADRPPPEFLSAMNQRAVGCPISICPRVSAFYRSSQFSAIRISAGSPPRRTACPAGYSPADGEAAGVHLEPAGVTWRDD